MVCTYQQLPIYALGAVMMHQGDTYLITALFPEAKTARAQKDRLTYFTAPIRCTNLFPIETLITFDCMTYKMCYGTIRCNVLKSMILIFQLKNSSLGTQSSTSKHVYHFSLYIRHYLIFVQSIIRDRGSKVTFIFNLNYLHVLVPLSFISKLSSLKGDLSDCVACICSMFSLILSTILVFSEESQTRISFHVCEHLPPRIFFFSSHAQFGKKAMELFPELVEMAKESVKACQCDKGCFSCIHSTYDSITEKAHVLCLLDSFNASLIGTEDLATLNYD